MKKEKEKFFNLINFLGKQTPNPATKTTNPRQLEASPSN